MARSALKSLTINTGSRADGQPSHLGVLSEQAARAISQLQRLEELKFLDCAFPALPGDQLAGDGGLSLLLGNLPPSLRMLELRRKDDLGSGTIVQVRLDAGRFSCVNMFKQPAIKAFTLDECARCAQPLLSCRAMGPTLGSLFLSCIVTRTGELDQPGSLDEPGVAPLRQLLRRSVATTVPVLEALSSEAALSLIQSVHRVHVLFLPCGFHLSPLDSQARLRRAQAAGAGAGGKAAQLQGAAGAAAVAPQPPPAIPPASELLPGVLQRLTVGPVAGGQAVAQPPSRRLVLLRGSLVAGLAATPQALRAWVEELGGMAAAAAGADTGRAVSFFEAYQVLPAAGAVIAASRRRPAPAAAVAAAAAGVTARAGAAGAVVVEAVSEAFESELPLGTAYCTALQQELQAAWDRLKGSCGGVRSAEVALLRGLLGRWEELSAGMPPEVTLS